LTRKTHLAALALTVLLICAFTFMCTKKGRDNPLDSHGQRISLNPASLQFQASANGSLPSSQTFTIMNTGGGTLNWSVSGKASWLDVSPTGPSNSDSATITVSVNTTDLSLGTYHDTITVSSFNADNSPQRVGVIYTVSAEPYMSLNPTSLAFEAVQNDTVPSSQTFSITNTGGGTLNWGVSDDATWLDISPTSGNSNLDTITVSINTTDLSPSTYNATITVSSTNADNSPQTVAVSYQTVSRAPDPVPCFELKPAGWQADWNTVQVPLRFCTLSGVGGYRIYAKDNGQNVDWVLIHDEPASDYLAFQEVTVTLPEEFDLYQNDAIQTPFSGGTHILFDISAYNAAGEGPLTASPITVADETAPNFTVNVCGSADNFVGASQANLTFDITGTKPGLGGKLEYCELTNNPTYSFTEAGGDPAYVLPGSAVSSWTWDADVRDGSGAITVPANKMAAADTFTVKIKDNSGNEGTAKFRLLPFIQFVKPTSTDTTFEAPYGQIQWNITNANCASTIDYLDLYVSWNNGTTWIDSIIDCSVGTNPRSYAVNDTLIVKNTAKIGIKNHAGGWRWLSQTFTVNGIKITSPDSVSYFDTKKEIFDDGNTDSTVIPLAWNSTTFISKVEIAYKAAVYDKNAVSWTPIDTVVNTGTYNFYAPSHGEEYDCWLRVADWDSDGHPRDTLRWWIHILHDSVKFSDPMGGEYCVDGGSTVFNIRWWNRYNGTWIHDTLPSLLDIDYAVDAQNDTNWVKVVDNTLNDGFHTWDTVPYTKATDYALLRILTHDSTEYVSDFFSISGLKITSPNGGENWTVGSDQTIEWDNYCDFHGNVDIQYSTNNGSTWSNIILNTANKGWFPWTVPNKPSTQCLIRIKENGVPIQRQDVSNNVFTIAGIIVTYPNTVNDRWLEGRDDSVKWSLIGMIGQTVAIDFSIDGGATYPYNITISGISVSGLFQFAVPVMPGPFPYTQCRVKVRDLTGTAADTSNANFKIDEPHIRVINPNGGESWQMGTARNITWDTVGLRSTSLAITLDTLSGTGGYPITVATVPVPSTSYLWIIPNLGPNNIMTCRIRIEEIGVSFPLNDVSDAVFTIVK
jgi:hypothetical protein